MTMNLHLYDKICKKSVTCHIVIRETVNGNKIKLYIYM